MGLLRRGDTPAQITIVEGPGREHVPQTGAVSSIQRAEVDMPAAELERLWAPEHLERLARAYWRYLNRISLGLLRVVYEPAARIVVLLFRPLALLRFRAPEYETHSERASVTWPIERGLLVGKDGRDQGYLRIGVKRLEGSAPGRAQLCVTAEVSNFYPWLRGSGRFARFGTWVYSHTQVRIHKLITHGFLRSLARLDLPPSRVGALRGEIEAGSQPNAEASPEGLPPERAGN
jgi:hypothetical protein